MNLPEGYTLDEPLKVDAGNASLPDGFTLDAPATAGVPEGFTLDQSPPAEPPTMPPSLSGASNQPGVLPLTEATDPGSLAFKDALEKAKGESALKAAGREAAMGVVPTLAGIGAGAAIGTAFTPGIGTAIGAIVGGIGTAVGADWLQGKAIEAVAPEQAAQLELDRAAAAQVHPYATLAGSLAPQLLVLKPSFKNVAGAFNAAKAITKGTLNVETPAGKVMIDQLANVGLGAGVQGAQEAYAQYQAGDLNAGRLLAQIVAGALINEPNKFGVKMGLHPTTGEPELVEVPPVRAEAMPSEVPPVAQDAIPVAPEVATEAIPPSQTAEPIPIQSPEPVVAPEGVQPILQPRPGEPTITQPSAETITPPLERAVPLTRSKAESTKLMRDTDIARMSREQLITHLEEQGVSKTLNHNKSILSEPTEQLRNTAKVLSQKAYEADLATIKEQRLARTPTEKELAAREANKRKMQDDNMPEDQNTATFRSDWKGRLIRPDRDDPLYGEITSAIPDSYFAKAGEGNAHWEDMLSEGKRLGLVPDDAAMPDMLEGTLKGRLRTKGEARREEEARWADEAARAEIDAGEFSDEVPFRTVLGEAKGGDAGKAKWIIRKTLGPKADVEIVDRIFEKGAERLGKYQKGLVTIAKGGNMERTAYHEAMHGAEDMLFTAKELDAVKRIMPDAEKRADAFMDYAAGKNGVTGQVKMYFDRLMYRIKKLFGQADGISELKAIHAKLMQGAMAKRGAKSGTGEVKYSNRPLVDAAMKRDFTKEGPLDITADWKNMTAKERQDAVSKGLHVEPDRMGRRVLANRSQRSIQEDLRNKVMQRAEQRKATGETLYRTPAAYDAVVKKFEEQEQANADMFKRKSGSLAKWFGRNWVSNTSPVEIELRKTAAGGKADWEDPVKKIERDLAAVRGASGESRDAMSEASERIFRANGIKDSGDMQHFNRLAQARRVVEIDELKRGQAAAERQRLIDLEKSVYDEAIAEADSKGKARPSKDQFEGAHWSQEDEAAFQKQMTEDMMKSPITVDEANAYIAQHETRADKTRFDKAHDEYQKTYKALLKESLDAGIISKDVYDYIDKNHKNYQPRVFLDKIDPVIETRNGRGGTIEVRNSGLQTLKEGSEGALMMDSPHLLMSKIIQTKTAIAKNKATKSLADYLTSKPDALDAKIVTKMSDAVPAGKERIFYREDGKMKAMDVNRDFAEAWRTSNPQMTQEAMKIMRYASGTAFVKFLATAGNPEFAVANLPRDLGFTFLASKEFSPFMPAAAYQQLRNIAKQAISKETRRTLMKYYEKEGGSTSYLSSMGHLEDFHNPGAITTGRRIANKVIEILGYPGNTSEAAVRIAHMQQALRNMGHTDFSEKGMARLASTPEGLEKIRAAVYAASNVLDFRQAGNMSKVVDQFVPFFNPAVQGARGVLRAFKERPAETSFRASQIIGLGALLAMYNRKTDEKAWESTSDVEKDSKAVFVTGITRKDSNGNERHVYVAPAIDQGWRPFFILGQMVGEKLMGKEVDPARITKSIRANYVPYEASNLPPVVAAMLTYSQNHDFWRNEKVWRGRDVEPFMERRASTPALATLAGDVTGMSPERLRAATSKLFPEHVASLALREAADKITGDKQNDEGWLSVNRLPFARKLLRLTSSRDLTHDKELAAKRLGVKTAGKAPSSILNEIEKAEKKQNTYRQKNDVTFDKMVAKVRSGEMTKAELYKAAWQVKNEEGKFDGKERLRILRLLKRKYPELKIVAPSGE